MIAVADSLSFRVADFNQRAPRYKWRHLIENFFSKLKEFKPVALRADKTDASATRPSSNSRTGPSRSPSNQRCAKRESLWRAASGLSCMRCCETRQSSSSPKPCKPRDRRPNPAPMRSDALGREQTTAPILLQGRTAGRLRFQPSRPAPNLPHQVPNEHAENAGTRKRRHTEELPPLTH